MPELPEVETVRVGLQRWVTGRTISTVSVLHARAIRRHLAGADDFSSRLAGAAITDVHRRGKYLWLSFADDFADGAASDCLLMHLGMSGQLLLLAEEITDGPHLRVRFQFADDGPELRFVDQRTFGGLALDVLAPSADGQPDVVPSAIVHIARDPLDSAFDDDTWVLKVRARSTTIKRALLDQTLVSGVGNIYADEALWRARLHGDRPCLTLGKGQLVELLTHIRAVFAEALVAGGTSFDSLYVDVNGSSGYFDRSLNAYGRAGQPCYRCGRPIARMAWMNRSSYFCPHCQRRPAGSSHAV